MVVGHILVAHTCSLMCTNHIPQPFLLSQVPLICMWQTAGHSHISYLWSNASRMVTHTRINLAHDCLTLMIKRKTFAPCYVSP